MTEQDKPSRGEQLREQSHKRRLRLMRTGFFLQLAGFLLPVGIWLLLSKRLVDEFIFRETGSNILFSISLLIGGCLLIVGCLMMSELHEPKLPKNKYRPVKQFHGAYRRKGEIPILIGVFYILYSVIRLITTIKG